MAKSVAVKWHAVDMDRYKMGPFSSAKAARKAVVYTCMDSRKCPRWRRCRKGEYEYIPQADPDQLHKPSYYVVSDERLQDWPAAFEQYEEKQSD